MDLGSIIVGLAGIAASTTTAVVALHYARRNTIALQAHLLYEKRVAGYSALVEMLSNFHADCLRLIHSLDRALTQEEQAAFQVNTQAQYAALNDLYRRWGFIMPLEVNRCFMCYFNTYEAIAGHPGAGLFDSKGALYVGSPNDPLQQSYYDAVNSIRADLGVDALSALTARDIRVIAKATESRITWLPTSERNAAS